MLYRDLRGSVQRRGERKGDLDLHAILRRKRMGIIS